MEINDTTLVTTTATAEYDTNVLDNKLDILEFARVPAEIRTQAFEEQIYDLTDPKAQPAEGKYSLKDATNMTATFHETDLVEQFKHPFAHPEAQQRFARSLFDSMKEKYKEHSGRPDMPDLEAAQHVAKRYASVLMASPIEGQREALAAWAAPLSDEQKRALLPELELQQLGNDGWNEPNLLMSRLHTPADGTAKHTATPSNDNGWDLQSFNFTPPMKNLQQCTEAPLKFERHQTELPEPSILDIFNAPDNNLWL